MVPARIFFHSVGSRIENINAVTFNIRRSLGQVTQVVLGDDINNKTMLDVFRYSAAGPPPPAGRAPFPNPSRLCGE